MIKINFAQNAEFLANALAKSRISVKDFIKTFKQDISDAHIFNKMLETCNRLSDLTVYNQEKAQIETEFFKERFYKRK